MQYVISKTTPWLVKDMEVNLKSFKEFATSNHTNWFHVSEYYKYIGLTDYSYLIDEAEGKIMDLVRSLGLYYRMGREGYLSYIIIPENVFREWVRARM